jgi:flap endonuclease-1
MGIKGLMPLIQEFAPGAVRELQGPESYTGRIVAIDASMSLYQFLIAIRGHGAGGHGPATVLTNSEGEQTSHIQGMFNRTIKLLESGVKPVYVFDGRPPEAKDGELAKRQAKRKEAEAKLKEATAAGDNDAITKYSGMLTKVSRKDCEDVKGLLRMMGVPVVEAPCEAEAQCGELVKHGKAHAVGTEDMDALTFGATRQLRNLTFSKKGKDSDKKILEITHARVLEGLGLSNAQFVDFCILCGCDYSGTIRGVGPKTALKLVKEHGSIERILATLPAKKRADVPANWLPPDQRVAGQGVAPPKKVKKPEVAQSKKPSPLKGAPAAAEPAFSAASEPAFSAASEPVFASTSEPAFAAASEPAFAAASEPAFAPASEPAFSAASDPAPAEPMAAEPTAEPAPAPEPMATEPTAPEPMATEPAAAEPAAEPAAAPAPAGDADMADGDSVGVEAPAEEAPAEETGPFVPRYAWARQLFLEHEVTPAANFDFKWEKPKEAELRTFLIEKMGFNADRVDGALKKLVKSQGARTQRRMDSFFKVLPPKPGQAKKKPVASKVAKKKSGGKGKPRK